MSDEMPMFAAVLELTSVQAEMLMQLVHCGLCSRLNAGWRKPEEWVALTSKIAEALEIPRNQFVSHRRTG